MKTVNQALLDFIDAFNNLGLRYAVMGGIAVRAHSIPRPTWDVDVAVEIARDELPKLFAAVEDKGYTVPEAYRRGWADPIGDVPLVKVRVYLEGGGVDVDVFLVEEPFQQEILKRSRVEQTDLGPVSIVTPEDLILMKLVAARPRDLIDVMDILFMQGQLDEAYMRRWAAKLGVLDRLEEHLSNPPTERP
jgi:hypothetical protein